MEIKSYSFQKNEKLNFHNKFDGSLMGDHTLKI